MKDFEFHINGAHDYVSAAAQEVGERVRLFRTKRGLTQTQLAAMAGVGERTVVRIESGSNIEMSLASLFSIAWALELQPVELFGFQNTRPLISNDEYQLVLAARKIFS